ncbi:hypothetical protein [Celerinatantimonas sp. YJH-8]|uniref:hypothetical protein n=1 Tax=Celerinatantimonas sp. YJH-8 TaxID=3228714 RepID=UPI0038C7037E
MSKHRHDSRFDLLPFESADAAHHYCSGCAYDLGYQAGLQQESVLQIDFSNLPERSDNSDNSVKERLHNPHAAFALGYADGVAASYGMDDDV